MQSHPRSTMDSQSVFELPSDLEERCLERFDSLKDQGRLLHEPTQPEPITHNGFQFEFRICPVLKTKPITGPNAAGRTKAEGPFVNPNPDEIIAIIGSAHRLMLNIFCMYRPMLLVTTIDYEPQANSLNRDDLKAAWSVLQAIKTPYVAIYNCGVHSGSSQGHKHMQFFPIPDKNIIELFPSKAKSAEDVSSDIPGVPFKHYVYRFSEPADIDQIHKKYQVLLAKTLATLEAAKQGGTDHNVVFTSEYICLIPRAKNMWGGPWGANAMGMLGLVSVRDQEERDEWTKLEYSEYLARLGIPNGGTETEINV